MADYERYGDYNNLPDEEDNGPPPSRGWVIFKKTIKWIVIAVVCAILLFMVYRLIFAEIYPSSIKKLYQTEAIETYLSSGGTLSAKTQQIRVPFECDVIASDGVEWKSSESQNGFYYADNLIIIEQTNSLQVSIRINKNAFEDIAKNYNLENLSFQKDSFSFVLKASTGESYIPCEIIMDSNSMYDYYKICFDGLSFNQVTWMRLEITPNGVDTTNPNYIQQAICIYENNDSYSQFKNYKLSKKERTLQ